MHYHRRVSEVLRRGMAAAAVVGWSVLACSSAQAHHSFAMFDQTQQVTLHGTVKDFQWTNPHSFIELVTVDASGVSTSWSVELNSPNNLKRQGWKSSSIKVGDVVTLVMNPLRDGRGGGLFIRVTLPDGTTLGDPTRVGSGPINVPGLK